MSVINPEHLLEQADRLLSLPTSGARRQVDVRRAISNSYYAVFHAVVTAAADEFVGRTHRHSMHYSLVYRSVDHKPLARLCEDILKTTLPKRYIGRAPPGGFGADLIEVANAVVELYERRVLADYDPTFRPKVSDAMLAVETARNAIDRLRSADATTRKSFLALAVFDPR